MKGKDWLDVPHESVVCSLVCCFLLFCFIHSLFLFLFFFHFYFHIALKHLFESFECFAAVLLFAAIVLLLLLLTCTCLLLHFVLSNRLCCLAIFLCSAFYLFYKFSFAALKILFILHLYLYVALMVLAFLCC